MSSSDFFVNTDRYMDLKIFVSSNNLTLKNLYLDAADTHNNKIFKNPFPDAGFDLFTPESYSFYYKIGKMVSFNIKCSAQTVCENGKIFNTGFYLYPRSSTGSKTKLRLANSVGIIDSGYRGELMGFFDCKNQNSGITQYDCDYYVSQYDKLVQICAPSLMPIYVTIVETENELGMKTARGDGGFGSTGS